VADDLARSRASTNDAITLWPDKEMAGARGLDFREKDRRLQKLIGADHAANTLPYKRLKTAMDSWCALWLWPLEKADLLPSRAEFLHGMAMILEGGFMPDGSLAAPSLDEFIDPIANFFDALDPDPPAKEHFRASAKKRQERLFRETDVDSLVQEVNWLGVAVEVAARERFTHYDLIFSDVLRARGGFDVIVGNPPWAKPSWSEADVIGDIDPGFIIRKLSAAQAREARTISLAKQTDRAIFLSAYSSIKGAMTATGSVFLNPIAGGGQNNLYRCFVDLSFRLTNERGIVALIHQDGHLSDPKSTEFRAKWYSRILFHFEFINRMKTKNFTEVGHDARFSLNIYRGHDTDISFVQFTNAFLASQVEESFGHDGVGDLPRLKNSDGDWDTRGHADKLVRIDRSAMTAIHALTGDLDTPIEQTRFVQPYSTKLLYALSAFSNVPRISKALDGIQSSRVWDETNAEKEIKVIRRDTAFHDGPYGTIISGPMIHVGNSLYKSPRRNCKSKADYDVINLTIAGDSYVPRTNYAVSAS
jgi:hypothetical protein